MIVDLWGAEGIIILCKSGVIYTNQAGGHACKHPHAEGVFIPLSALNLEKKDKLLAGLDALFLGDKYCGWCDDGIDKDDAKYLNRLFKKCNCPFKIDETRLKDCMEAWLYIIITEDIDGRLKGVKGRKAILTWSNSD